MKKLLSFLLVVLLTLSLFTACSAPAAKDGTSTSENASKSVKVGVLAPLTGANAEFGKGFEVAMTMAMNEVNAAGGFNGRTMELVLQASTGDA